MREVPVEEARRIAVCAQGLDGRANGVLETVRRLGFLQLDPISSVAPPQHLVLWSRLGAFDTAELDRLLWQERKLVEWRAFLYPSEDLPMLKAFMRRRDRPHDRRIIEWIKARAAYRRHVLKELRERGPLLSREIADAPSHRREDHRWWGQRQMGLMLELLAARGEVAVVGRQGKQRVWDLAERWYPETETLPLPKARRLYEEKRFRALGVQLQRGRLVAHPEAEDGPVPPRTTFLSPFDRLVHDRDRTEALWDFFYRLEMYVPAAKREYGYYVLPILHGDRLVGRIEPVFDRKEPPAERQGRLVGAGREEARPVRASGRARTLVSIVLMDFETRAIHDGQEPDPATGAIITPIYQTSTYVQDAVGEHKGYDYSRVANPTRNALQTALASLESAEHGIAFSSGLGATTTLMHLVDPGQRVVLIADVYGGVYRMTSQVYEPKGYLFDYVPADEFPNLARASRRQHAHGLDRVAVEPAAERRRHPRGRGGRARGRRDPRRRQHVRDAVPAAAARARRRRRRPLDDEVPRRPLRRRRRLRRDERPDDRRAAVLPAEVARRRARARSTRWLVLRGIKTLAVRMRQHCENAMAIAAVARAALARRARPLPGAAVASRPRDRGAPDARLRRHGLVPRRVAGGGRRARRRARSSSSSRSRSAASRA